jgi:DNA polymerase III subunit gamma/tau
MSAPSQTLYRKYRPATFDDVVGQENVVKSLRAMIEKKKQNKSMGHAFIFAGGRGIGKTTIARIFAKELGVSEKDLYEIDAASYTGVDNIRELRDGVSTMPFDSPYKVYILDEAHMLSRSAFNALLKTLEEPPAHVIFMMATTELNKLPDTVISRCEVYMLERPSKDTIAKVLVDIAKREGYALELEHADTLALVGDGSFRNALSCLQQVLTNTTGKVVTEETVAQITHAPHSELVFALLANLAQGNVEGALETIERARTRSASMPLLAERLLDAVRAVLVYTHAPKLGPLLATHFSEAECSALQAHAQNKEPHAVAFFSSKTLLTILTTLADITHSPRPDVLLEALCIELCTV